MASKFCAPMMLALLATLATAGFLRAEEPFWYEDYSAAMRKAQMSERMLLIAFHDSRYPDIYGEYFRGVEVNDNFQAQAKNFVLCKLPLNCRVPVPPTAAEVQAATLAGKEPASRQIRLVDHPAFEHLHGHAGFAIIDYLHKHSRNYGHVVNIYPFRSRFLAAENLAVMMTLPEGSLTQRSMIFAVLTHPERPASATGEFSRALAAESESHSRYQARLRTQGHHHWESRFHRINARLGRGMLSQEVVAESWPNQDLMTACEECVDSWRQSSGHWSAVRSRQRAFAFDIKRGLNGIWYATGIFGR